ncbi:hypothetical protein RCZ15_24400 [Capnocytophaga catalasegens]|uniref:Uncharacterized protein n=1 Tax=Capnocytophaga catalasegens TaxID=1004260 RepID=A0AAV5B0C0_9FLAO|nr:hypothetical protein [Capnocytophaga catalasegens]GIZ14178.1 hypothetical protein RCZ03_01790 [Capnocytophaga catalasegens]GJM51467.1 hypothetical protein RCZ15_24400 [Capnocytophaga catalasegens]
MMAKGSKSWYEVYERRISDIEKEEELCIGDDYKMKTSKCLPWSLDNNLLTTRAGGYSVSKLNIVIGIILYVMWSIIFFVYP